MDEYYSSVSLQGEYGCHVRTVFAKLRSQNFQELFKPASEQFNGTGSYGNGGAMRVAPVALFCNKDFKHMLHVAEQITQITHTHPLGINGALLQVQTTLAIVFMFLCLSVSMFFSVHSVCLFTFLVPSCPSGLDTGSS